MLYLNIIPLVVLESNTLINFNELIKVLDSGIHFSFDALPFLTEFYFKLQI